MPGKNIFEINEYIFENKVIEEIKHNQFVKNLWPVVYILSNSKTNEAYIGETTDTVSRLKTHLKHPKKKSLTAARLITSDVFNKSATLDIEANLIRYIAGEGKFRLLNANIGIANHNYYQKNDVYWEIFQGLWNELQQEGLVSSTLKDINNSDLFKYSPYKALSNEQKNSLIELVRSLLDENAISALVERERSGTGKTILAIYLFTLLHTDIEDLDLHEFNDDTDEFLELVRQLKNRYPNPKAALVIPMSGFRETIKMIFQKVKNLSSDMVIGPAEVTREHYDLIIVDESHRLRKRVNLGAYFGAFDTASRRLGFDPAHSTELDWILKNSTKQIFFYDQNQSIKPSDVSKEQFTALRERKGTINLQLHSQLRSMGGDDYVSFVDRLLSNQLNGSEVFSSKAYELKLFDSLDEMVKEIKLNNATHGLSRMVAGYAWEWKSRRSDVYDIEIDGVRLKWNGTNSDWVNSKNALNEVGCIHTTQGYDLNYTGIIFGNEIVFNAQLNRIEVKSDKYFDKNGKQNVQSEEELHAYIINIYKTLLLRAIKGTYIYVCDPSLREYFSKHIKISEESVKGQTIFKKVSESILSPYTTETVMVPLVGSAPCGEPLLGESNIEEMVPVEKNKLRAGTQYFIVRAEGDSMNQVGIEDGDLVLCRYAEKAETGDRVVALLGGENVTIKYYDKKDGRRILLPKSSNPRHQPVIPEEGDIVQGIVQEVLPNNY